MKPYVEKSKRVREFLLEGIGMQAHGYWVDYHLHFVVKRLPDGAFQFTQFKQLPLMIVRYEIVSQHVYTDLEKVTTRMRKIAPIKKWHSYNLQSWFQRETGLEELLAAYEA